MMQSTQTKLKWTLYLVKQGFLCKDQLELGQ